MHERRSNELLHDTCGCAACRDRRWARAKAAGVETPGRMERLRPHTRLETTVERIGLALTRWARGRRLRRSGL